MRKLLPALVIPLLLGACGSIFEAKPVGQGTGNNDLKRSPCACYQVPQMPITPAYLQSLGS